MSEFPVNVLVQIIESVLHLHDEVNFIENKAKDGGALYIASLGQLKVYPNTTVSFERNEGR